MINALMISPPSGGDRHKWTIIPSPSITLRLLEQAQFRFYRQDEESLLDFYPKTHEYYAHRYRLGNIKIWVWVPNSVQYMEADLWITNKIVNRDFAKVIKEFRPS